MPIPKNQKIENLAKLSCLFEGRLGMGVIGWPPHLT